MPQTAHALSGPTYWKAFEDARQVYLPRWRGRLTRIADDEWREVVLPTLETAGTLGAAVVYIEQKINSQAEKRWLPAIQHLYADVAGGFALRTMQSLNYQDQQKDALESALAGEMGNAWANTVATWLRSQAGSKIRHISAGTLWNVRRELAEAVRLGESIPQAMQRLRQAGPGITAARGTTIARTEIIAASNLGSRAGAAQTGLKLDHEWISTPGPRTRAAHAAASGQIVPQEEPFEVDGERLLFPGDGSLGASAANLVNCRCTVAYLPAAERPIKVPLSY